MHMLMNIVPGFAFFSACSAAFITLTLSAPSNVAFDNLVINAAGQAFYAGLDSPGTYCPTFVDQCPHNGSPTETVLAGLSALWVEVPGGQQVYTNVDGALGYTQAHSAYVPIGAFIGGYVNKTIQQGYGDEPFVVYTWPSDNGAKGGIYACPYPTPDIFKIYAGTPAFNRTDCTEVAGLLPHLADGTEYGAWQYT